MNCTCGFGNAADARFCGRCGAVLARPAAGPGGAIAAAAGGPPAPGPTADAHAASLHVCACGFVNAPGARYCGKCGAAVGAEAAGHLVVGAPAAAPRSAVAAEPSDRLTSAVHALPRRMSKLQIAVLGLATVLAAVGYWWFHRPPGPYKPDNSGLWPIKVDGKYGFMDRSGKTVIPPQFDRAFGFEEGLAVVQIGNKRGYINTEGTVVVTPQFDWAEPFRYGRASVNVGDGWGCIDERGKYIGAPNYRWVGDFSGNVAPVKAQDGEVALLDRSGKIIHSGRFDDIGDFNEGLAPAASHGKWGLVNAAGKWVVEPQFESVGPFGDGLAPVQVGGQWGYVDRQGKFIVNPQYGLAGGFSEGYAFVERAGKFAVIDRNGRLVSNTISMSAFSEGMAAVGNGDGWGFMDTTGTMVIAQQFDEAGPFTNGLAWVTVLGKEAYITREGKFVIDPFPGSTIEKERARIRVEDSSQLHNLCGEWVGAFYRNPSANLTITGCGGGICEVTGVLLHEGWRENFVGSALVDGTARLNGTSVSQVAEYSIVKTFSLDTIEVTVSSDGMLLSGNIRDKKGNTGRIEMRRVAWEDLGGEGTRSLGGAEGLMDEREIVGDVARDDNEMYRSLLSGTWRFSNCTVTYAADGSKTDVYDSGARTRSKWIMDDDVIVVAQIERLENGQWTTVGDAPMRYSIDRISDTSLEVRLEGSAYTFSATKVK